MAGNVAEKTRDAEIFGYRNPFAVLACSADSSGTEIQQYAQRALMERRLAGESKEAREQIELIERSRDHLKDPIRRFRASIFWLILTDQEQASWVADPELKNLAYDTTLLAGESFSAISRTDSVATFSHNMAVLLCADAHRLALLGDSPGAVSSWADGFEQWSLCLSSSEYLSSVSRFAQELDDPRINTRFIRQQLEAIPRELLSEPAALASKALERRDTAAAMSFVDLIRTAPFEADFIDGVLEMVYRPIARRVENDIDSLERRRKDALDSGETSTLKHVLHKVLHDFASHTAPDLEQMLKLGDLPGLAEEHARDHAARFLQSLSISMWNRAEDADSAEKATKLAEKYADARSLKSKLHESAEQIHEIRIDKDIDGFLGDVDISEAPKIISRLKEYRLQFRDKDVLERIDSRIDDVKDGYAAFHYQQASSALSGVVAFANGEMPRTEANRLKAKLLLQRADEHLVNALKWARSKELTSTILSAQQAVARVNQQKTSSGCLVFVVGGILVALICAAQL